MFVRKIRAFFVLVLFFVISCSKEEQFSQDRFENRPEGIFCAPVESSKTLENGELTFNKDHMFCVAIDMSGADFKEMRNSSRFGPSIQDQGGLVAEKAAFEYFNQCDVPFPSYYKWYRANLEIDGIAVSNVGVRKKGFFGSIYSSAPSLKINTAKYNTQQIIGNTKNITFNNNSEDPSRVIQCLFYKFLEWANYPAPRCNLANVSINGEPLGVYSHVEAIDYAFLDRNFGNHSGSLYECQLTDFRSSWLERWESKTDYTDKNKYFIAKIAYILSKTPTNDLLYKLDKYVNVKRFIQFWALEIVMNHTDGYSRNSNNTYVYFDPSDRNRATFIPSGINSYYKYNAYDDDIGLKEFTSAELSRRLSRSSEAVLLLEKEIHHLLDNVWDENAMLAIIDHFEPQIKTAQEESIYHSVSRDYLPDFRYWIERRKQLMKDALMYTGFPRGHSEPSKICHFEE